MAYDFEHEAQRIIDAVEPKRGAQMTLVCALREAYEAGRQSLLTAPPETSAIDEHFDALRRSIDALILELSRLQRDYKEQIARADQWQREAYRLTEREK